MNSSMLLIKVGGGNQINWDGICQNLCQLTQKEKVVMVHGASVQRDELAAKLSIPVKTVVSPSGITSVYTDGEALDVFLMAYAGLVNKRIVAKMHQYGLNAVGLSGIDGKLWQAKAKKELLIKEGDKVKLVRDNRTGRVENINTELINLLLEHRFIPVICPPALSFENEVVNTDSDWAVAVMAEALRIKRVVFLFEAPGFLRDHLREESLIPHIEKGKIGEYLEFAHKRMKKKLLGAKRALEGGVEIIFLWDGRRESPVKDALDGKGTVIN